MDVETLPGMLGVAVARTVTTVTNLLLLIVASAICIVWAAGETGDEGCEAK